MRSSYNVTKMGNKSFWKRKIDISSWELPILMMEIILLLSIVFLVFSYYSYSWEYFSISFAAFIIIYWRLFKFKTSDFK